MNWPDLSPDLNPIEHLWDEIQRQLNDEQPSLTTAAELSLAFQRVWALIPIAFINHLVNSMYRRCAAVINACGGHTRY
jgi:transposase